MEKLQPNNSQLCIIDDESRCRNALSIFLEDKGYNVVTLEPDCLENEKMDDIRELRPACYVIGEEIPLQQNAYNVVLLNGAKNNPPTSPKYIASVLDGGADFVAERTIKPVVLEAHIAAMLRRPREEENKTYKLGNITMRDDMPIRYGDDIYFTRRESDVLSILIKSAGKPVPIPQLITEMFGNSMPSDRANIKILILRLRKKFGDNPKKPKIIKTLKRFGYKLEPDILGSSNDVPQRSLPEISV